MSRSSSVARCRRPRASSSYISAVTLALAIWGAVTGTASILLEAFKYLRDRPRLSLSVTLGFPRGYSPEIGVDVRNQGRQPTTVMKVALRPEGEAEIEKDGVTLASGQFELGLDDERPVVVMPGQVAQFRVSLTRWPGPIHADEPLRAYVVDSHDRLTWGGTAPLRVFLNEGWRPEEATPDVLKPLPGAPIRPTAVEPRWKLWKPKELRRPSLPPPQAWPPGRA
jgi:hypothetical protein